MTERKEVPREPTEKIAWTVGYFGKNSEGRIDILVSGAVKINLGGHVVIVPSFEEVHRRCCEPERKEVSPEVVLWQYRGWDEDGEVWLPWTSTADPEAWAAADPDLTIRALGVIETPPTWDHIDITQVRKNAVKDAPPAAARWTCKRCGCPHHRPGKKAGRDVLECAACHTLDDSTSDAGAGTGNEPDAIGGITPHRSPDKPPAAECVCDGTGCPRCDPEWAEHQVRAPDALVAKVDAALASPKPWPQDGDEVWEVADGDIWSYQWDGGGECFTDNRYDLQLLRTEAEAKDERYLRRFWAKMREFGPLWIDERRNYLFEDSGDAKRARAWLASVEGRKWDEGARRP
jgi:hypothetical protein